MSFGPIHREGVPTRAPVRASEVSRVPSVPEPRRCRGCEIHDHAAPCVPSLAPDRHRDPGAGSVRSIPLGTAPEVVGVAAMPMLAHPITRCSFGRSTTPVRRRPRGLDVFALKRSRWWLGGDACGRTGQSAARRHANPPANSSAAGALAAALRPPRTAKARRPRIRSACSGFRSRPELAEARRWAR